MCVHDFLCSAVETPELDDEPQALNNLVLDYSPVSVVRFHSVNKTQSVNKVLTILFDTVGQKSVVRAEHSHLGQVSELWQPITFCTPDTKFKVTRVSET